MGRERGDDGCDWRGGIGFGGGGGRAAGGRGARYRDGSACVWEIWPRVGAGEAVVVNVTLLDVEPGYDFVFIRPAANGSGDVTAFGAAWIRLTGRDRCAGGGGCYRGVCCAHTVWDTLIRSEGG